MPYDPLADSMNDPIFGPGTPATADNPNTAAMAQLGAQMNVPFSGVPMPPMLPPPTFSDKLLQAAAGAGSAGAKGGDFGEQLTAALGGYHNAVQEGYDKQNQNYTSRLNEYGLLGQIRSTQMTELMAARKMQAMQQIQQDHPELAPLFALDPSAAIEKLYPKPVKLGPGESLIMPGAPGEPAKDMLDGSGRQQPPMDTATNQPLKGQAYAGWLQQSSPNRFQDAQMALSGSYPEMTPTNRNQYIQVMRDANSIDPTFNPANYSSMKKTLGDYATDGKSGQTLTSIGAAANHLGSAMSNYHAIGNGDNSIFNWAKNGAAHNLKGPRGEALAAYQTDINGYAPEMAKISSGSGEASDTGTAAEKEPFGENSPNVPAAFKASAGRIAGKYASMMQTYAGSIGPRGNLYTSEQFSPETKATFKGLGYDLDQIKQNAFSSATQGPLRQGTALDPAFGGSPAPTPATTSEPAAPTAQKYTAQNPAKPVTQKDFDSLQKGDYFINPKDKKILVKK